MPSAELFDFHRPAPETDANTVFIEKELRCLLQNPLTGLWARDGVYVEGEAILPNLRADKISELYSLEQICKIDLDKDGNPLGTIGYQVSNDDGATWLYWDGAAWSPAGPTDFATFSDTSENLPTFPIRTTTNEIRQIRFKVRLTPATDTAGVSHTPSLFQLKVNYELDYNFHEDIKRSLKRYMDQEIRMKTRFVQTLDAATDTFVIDPFFGLDQITSVYNLTTDPGRTTDLFDFNSGLTITMTAAQSIGDDIEVNFLGTAPVFLSADKDLIISTLPAFVVILDDTVERKDRREGGHDIWEIRNTDGDKTARRRHVPLWHDAFVTISSLSNGEVATLAMTDAVSKPFQFLGEFRLHGSGELASVVEYTPFAEADDIRDGLYLKSASLQILVAEPAAPFEEVPLTTEINIGIGTMTSVESNLSITE